VLKVRFSKISLTVEIKIFYAQQLINMRKLTPYLLRGLINLPQRVVCHQCGYILYDGDELKPPDEILQEYNGKCPKCGRKLALIPLNVEVKPMK